MTKKEAIEFLTNTKVYVKNQSKEIQLKLFSLGFRWGGDSDKLNYFRSPFIYIYNEEFYKGEDVVEFNDSFNKEITPEDILNITIEPRYKPFKSAEECIEEMRKHTPFGWLKAKNKDFYVCITSIYNTHNIKGRIIHGLCKINDNSTLVYKLSEFFESYTFLDGTSFGIKMD